MACAFQTNDNYIVDIKNKKKIQLNGKDYSGFVKLNFSKETNEFFCYFILHVMTILSAQRTVDDFRGENFS